MLARQVLFHLPSFFSVEIRSQEPFCPGWPGNAILPILTYCGAWDDRHPGGLNHFESQGSHCHWQIESEPGLLSLDWSHQCERLSE
jgi:hypothetical protein